MSKWIAVEAFNKGYRVTDDGTVLSPQGEALRCTVKDGYPHFTIVVSTGKRRPLGVHRLVAYAKYGEDYLVKGIVARHKDSNKLNNRFDNILIGTQSDNSMDRPEEQRKAMAAAAARKFTDEEIQKWRDLNAAGVPYRKIQAEFGVPRSTLSYYLSRKAKLTTWALPFPPKTEEPTP